MVLHIQLRVQLRQPRRFLRQFFLLRKGLFDLCLRCLLLLFQVVQLVLGVGDAVCKGVQGIVQPGDAAVGIGAQRYRVGQSAFNTAWYSLRKGSNRRESANPR